MSNEAKTHEESAPIYRLCLARGQWAWFTTQAVANQTGDDWNDAPADCNAGDPYEGDGWDLLRVAHCSPYSSQDGCWSVDEINAGAAPWLYDFFGDQPPIFAGVTFDEFCAAIKASGGTVYVPKEEA